MAVAAATAPPTLRTAWVAGANGLTGSALVRLMLRSRDYGRVEALTRRPLPVEHQRLVNRVLKYEEMTARLAGARCDDAFCCLGATGGPRADPVLLRQVDLDLAVAFARAARASGASRLVVLSAASAAPDAPHGFRRIKGELQAALRELKFSALDILQPGVVLGERPGSGVVDTLRQAVAPLVNVALVGRLQDARWITGADLAAAMLGAARGQRRGVNTYSGKRLQQLTAAGTRQA